MPKGDKSISAIKASNVADQANTSPGGASTPPSAILEAIATLKSELKEDNDKLRKDINNMGQEMGKKLDNLTEEMRGLTERMEGSETRVGRVEDMTLDLTEALTESIKRQRSIQNKLTDLESRSRRNNIRLFGVGKGEEGRFVLRPGYSSPHTERSVYDADYITMDSWLCKQPLHSCDRESGSFWRTGFRAVRFNEPVQNTGSQSILRPDVMTSLTLA
ncbi:hypothetical protein E1301_Tti019066 [Triplophysa tibetana]|uniref:Uncharacterized protein n=1 Tax=Triplophysa tibetana TaxID=1572043 RepID=A0A5A9NSU0_9TELE|nr:hypothetical protein E1301_Tti019066 [Triplophysa tibetana]